MRFVCDSCRAQYMISDDKVGAKGVKVRCKKCGHVILVKRGGQEAAAQPAPPAPATVAMSGGGAGLEEETQATQVLMNPLGDSPPPPPSDAMGGTDMPTVMNGTANPFFNGVDQDEIGAVFDSVLGGLPASEGAGGEDTAAANGFGDGGGDAGRTHAEEGGDNRLELGDPTDDRLSTRVLDAETMKKLASETAGMTVVGGGGGGAPEKKEEPSEWYVAIDEKQVGPLSPQKVKDLWDRGEIGPDSLCWKAGMGDWSPVSDVQELASHLAPQPKKPVVVAPATLNPGVMTVPVESNFSAGGLSQSVRSEMPMFAGAGAGASEDVAWKPSAASALASLVQEEINALTSPKPRADEAQGRSMLDLAPAGAPQVPAGASAVPGMSMMNLPPVGATAPASAMQIPAVQGAPGALTHTSLPPQGMPMADPYASSPPSMYSQPPAYAPYPPQPAPQQSRNGLLYALGGVAILALLLLTGAVLYLAMQRTPEPVVATRPTVRDDDVPPPSAAKKGTKPAEAAPVAKAAEPAAAKAADPAPAPEATAAAAGAAEKPAAPAEAAERRSESAAATSRAESRRERSERSTSSRSGGGSDGAETIVAAAKPEAPTKNAASGVSGDDDEFCREFGCDKNEKKGGGSKGGASSAAEKPKSSTPSVYVPPAPGSADIPNTLGQADIMQVVLANKPSIVQCVSEQKKKEPGLSGRLVMRWTILTSGRTSAVTVRSEEFRSTYMATCIAGLIKGWKFPRHRTQGDPIDFPFTF